MNQSITTGPVWTRDPDGHCPASSWHQFVAFMGLKGTAAEAAARYLTIELCVLPAIMVERVAIACLRGAGDTVSGLVVMAIVNVINMGVKLRALPWRRDHCPNSAGPASPWAPPSATAAAPRSYSPSSIGGRAGYHLRLRDAARFPPHPPHPANRHPRRPRRDRRQHLPPRLPAGRACARRCRGRGPRRRHPSRSARLHAGRRVSDFRPTHGRTIHRRAAISSALDAACSMPCAVVPRLMVAAGICLLRRRHATRRVLPRRTTSQTSSPLAASSS